MRLIKRYPNRKLYDVAESRYIKLDEIGDLIRSGEEIKVVDSKNNDDLTATTMAQVLLEEGKKKKRIPVQTLKGLLMTGSEFLSKKISTPVTTFREEAEKKVKKMRSDAIEDVKELITGTQKAYDEVQKVAEERIRLAVNALARFSNTNKDLNDLMEEVKKLKVRISNLERALKNRR